MEVTVSSTNYYQLTEEGLKQLLKFNMVKTLMDDYVVDEDHNPLNDSYHGSPNALCFETKLLFKINNFLENIPNSHYFEQLVTAYFKQLDTISNRSDHIVEMEALVLEPENNMMPDHFLDTRQAEFALENDWIERPSLSFYQYFLREVKDSDDVIISFLETTKVFKDEHGSNITIAGLIKQTPNLSDSKMEVLLFLDSYVNDIQSLADIQSDFIDEAHSMADFRQKGRSMRAKQPIR